MGRRLKSKNDFSPKGRRNRVNRAGGELTFSGINAPGVRDLDIGFQHVQMRIGAKLPNDRKLHGSPRARRNHPTKGLNTH